jgi:carboxyl-terminal processing protease
MKSFKITLLIIVILSTAATVPTQATRSKASYQEVFQSIWQMINEHYYDPDFAGVDWKAIRERYRPQTELVADDQAFLALMGKMLKELPVSHLSIRTFVRVQETGGIYAQIRSIDEQQVVTALPVLSHARTQGLRAGDVILTPLTETTGPLGSTITLRVKGCDGRERTLEVRREANGFPPGGPLVQWLKTEVQPGKRIGYLRIGNFEEGTVGQINDAMNNLRNTAGLIIDLRGNPGGTNSFIRLASYLVSGQQFVSGLLTRPFLNRQKGKLDQIDLSKLPKMAGVYSIAKLLAAMAKDGAIGLYTEDLGENAYLGKVAILIDERTASAAEGFVAYMKEKTKCTIIGRATAGQLLLSNSFQLPNGWQLILPIAVPISSDRKLFKDTPITPHIEVKWTRQDVCEGRDPDIAKALESLALRLTGIGG